MRIVIIEDEVLAIERLQLILTQLDPSIEVVATLSGIEDSIKWFQEHPQPDLLFLDIELSDGICFGIFEKVAVKCPVIFTTAYDQYALDAFQLFSIDYLLKPVTSKAMQAALVKYRDVTGSSVSPSVIYSLIDSLKDSVHQYKNRFLVKLGARMFFVDAKEVAYFYADDKTTYLIHSNGSKYVVDHTLEKLQQVMDPKQFFRLNRKVICSGAAIKEIKHYINSRLKIILKAGTHTDEAVVSRERVQAFKEWAEG